ncbi:LysR family transcriptional regulator [Planococcus sp. 4-30]
MDEKDWRIITTIYEEKNITKAANKLFTSQPAITYRLLLTV